MAYEKLLGMISSVFPLLILEHLLHNLLQLTSNMHISNAHKGLVFWFCHLAPFHFVFWLFLSLNNFESRQVGNRVPGNFKHAAPTLSVSELSDMPRRTPKKLLMTAEVNKLKLRLLLLILCEQNSCVNVLIS